MRGQPGDAMSSGILGERGTAIVVACVSVFTPALLWIVVCALSLLVRHLRSPVFERQPSAAVDHCFGACVRRWSEKGAGPGWADIAAASRMHRGSSCL